MNLKYRTKKIVWKAGIVLLLIASTSSTPVYSQDTPRNGWDLAACIAYAKSHNIQLGSLRLNSRLSRQDLVLAKSAVQPDLYGTAATGLSHYNKAASGAHLVPSGSLGVSSSWTLYRGGYLRTDIHQKNLSIQSADLDTLAYENDIVLNITRAYLTILLDKETIVYAEDLLHTSELQLSQMKQRYEAGTVARKDMVQLEAQVAGDRYSLTSAQNAERQHKLTLKQVLQLPSATGFDIVKPAILTWQQSMSSLAEVQSDALINRPEVKASEMDVRISELDLKKARAGFKPTLTMSGSTGSGFSKDPDYTSLQQFNNNFYQQAGLTLSIPIFTKGVNRTNVEKAKINIEDARLTLQNTKTVLLQAIEQAYIDVENAQAQYNASIEQLKYNQEVYRIAGEELKTGTGNTVQFSQQRNLYVQALQSYIQAKYNAVLSVKIYEFYRGRPIIL